MELAIGGEGSQLAVIRVLRLARVLRIFKMGKSNKGMQMMGKVMVMSAPALYILGACSELHLPCHAAHCAGQFCSFHFTSGSSHAAV